MFLVVLGILSIVLAFPTALYRWVQEPGLVVACVAGASIVPVIIAVFVGRRVVSLLESRPDTPGDGQFAFGRGMAIVQAVLALCHAAVLLGTDWLRLCRKTPIVGDWPLVPGMLAVVPFLLSLVLVWIVTHPADRGVRQIALEVNLFRGRPVRPVWTLSQHLAFNLRHQVLFILIPMFLILAARDLAMKFDQQLQALLGHRNATDLVLGASAGFVAIIAPAILRRVWVTEPLPNGPLRDRLTAICAKLKLRFREILVWRSGGMIVNAAVMGLIAPLRYVLITDAMLEQMEDRKIEGVFGHEAGHIKRHHIPFFLLFALISGCLVFVFTLRADPPPPAARMDRATVQILATVGGVLLLLKWGVLFGWISRRFERQADVYGVRTLALSGIPCSTPCALHSPPEKDDDTDPIANRAESESSAAMDVLSREAPLCSTAAHLFSEALNEVAVLNGIPPEARSWRHSSISSRSRFLQRLARDPRATRAFEQLLYRIKVAIFVAALASTLWAAWEMRIWTLVGLNFS